MYDVIYRVSILLCLLQQASDEWPFEHIYGPRRVFCALYPFALCRRNSIIYPARSHLYSFFLLRLIKCFL